MSSRRRGEGAAAVVLYRRRSAWRSMASMTERMRSSVGSQGEGGLRRAAARVAPF